MLAVPPTNSGAVGVVLVMFFPLLALRNTVFGSSRMAWAMVPAAMNFPRSCGSLAVLVFDASWLANRILLLVPITNGVMSTAGIVGGPAIPEVGARHWAVIVVPRGMDAIRINDSPSTGSPRCRRLVHP